MKAKYGRLLLDADVKRWYRNLARDSYFGFKSLFLLSATWSPTFFASNHSERKSVRVRFNHVRINLGSGKPQSSIEGRRSGLGSKNWSRR